MNKNLTIANIITSLRIVLTFFLIVAYPYSKIVFTVLLIIVALSDRLDGYLARRLNQQTRLGEILDPVSDKILIITLIIIIVINHLYPSPIIIFPLLIRDVIAAPFAIFSACNRKKFVPNTGWWGKRTTEVLLSTLILLFIFGNNLITTSLIILTGIIGCIAGINYAKKVLRLYKNNP